MVFQILTNLENVGALQKPQLTSHLVFWSDSTYITALDNCNVQRLLLKKKTKTKTNTLGIGYRMSSDTDKL